MGAYNFFEFSGADAFAPLLGMGAVMLLVWLLAILLYLGLLVCVYVFQSIGLYTVAKRRQIRHAWLSWLPLGNMWILGSISDQYQYVAKGQIRNKRKALLGLTITMIILSAVAEVFLIGVLGVAGGSLVGGSMPDTTAILGAVGILALVYLVLLVVSIIAVVYQYMALYDYYRSCDPNSSTVFLVLSILFSVTMPFFMFAVRKKDLGMPPRVEETTEPIPPQILEQPEEEQPEQ